MKQAIEEGFILDVLSNFTRYETFYQINKLVENDPRCKTNSAKRQIARFVQLHETNIGQRIEVIVEHFKNMVMDELGGQAKAMVITSSRPEAVKYQKAFQKYIEHKGYKNIHALVAFSGKVNLEGEEYTESSMNGFNEERLTKEFDKDEYQVLIVANKYQTGFDQPKLCAMYVLKKLKGVNAVQTLSRLNRICPPFDKKVFVLDFANTYEDIQKAFAPYYTTTLLSNSVTPSAIYDLEVEIDGYLILNDLDIESFNEILYSGKEIKAKERKMISFYLDKARKEVQKYPYGTQKDIIQKLRSFVRFYEFLLQASSFEDVEIHKKYNFISYLLAYISIKNPGAGFDLTGKIQATKFVQKKTQEHKDEEQTSKPIVKLPSAEAFGISQDKEQKLSEIIEEINSRTGKAYNKDVAVKAMLQITDILGKNEQLKESAKNNSSKEFETTYYDNIDDALIEGLNQNEDFFTLLLNHPEMKKEVMGIFVEELYKRLRNEK